MIPDFKFYRNVLLLIFIFSIISSYCNAQRVITGKVINYDTGEPLKGIAVKVKGTKNISITDLLGNYRVIVPDTLKTIEFYELNDRKIKEVEMITSNQINLILTSIPIDFFGMTLSELMNIEITTVSKKAESRIEAPAIISIITRYDIVDKGYTSLSEAITSLPGVNNIQTYWGFNQLFFRGIYSTLYNDKTLVLINGHPFWGAVNSSYYIESFPIEAVERIEVIRGPGSTLYGTNAFAGVINIITTNNGNDKGINKTSGYMRGNQDFKNFSGGVFVKKSSRDINYTFSGQVNSGKGYDLYLPEEEGGRTNLDYNFINNNSSIYSRLKYKDFAYDLYLFQQEKSKIDAIPWVWGSTNQTHNNFKGIFHGLTYDIYKNDKLTIYTRGSYNNIYRIFNSRVYGYYAKYISDGSRFDVELNGGYQFNENISFSSGVQYEYVIADYYRFVDSDTDSVIAYGFGNKNREASYFGGYIDSDFKLWNIIKIKAGLRISYNKNYNTIVNPRFGIVYKATENLYIKALYGNAYRAPNLFEKYWNFGTTFGSEDLSVETINTYEANIEYTYKNFSIKANYFYNQIQDLIGRELRDTTTHYVNLNGISTTQGIETELKTNFSKNLSYYLNGTYLIPKDTSGITINYIPKFFFNTGLIYNYKRLFSNISFDYICETQNTVNGNNITISDIPLINIKIGYNITDDLSLSLIGKNLLNSEQWAPEFIRKNITKLPNGVGRIIFIELRYNLSK